MPALRDVTEAVAAGVDFQWQHCELIGRTLETIQRYSDMFAQFRSFVSLIAVRERPESGTANTSHSQLPGAFMVSVVDNPLSMWHRISFTSSVTTACSPLKNKGHSSLTIAAAIATLASIRRGGPIHDRYTHLARRVRVYLRGTLHA